MSAQPQQAAEQFAAGQSILGITPLGNGLINDTFRVATGTTGFVLQRINANVFPDPRLVIENLARLNLHIRQKPRNTVRLQIPELLPCRDGRMFYWDDRQQLWRALQLIQPAESRERLYGDTEAAQVGFALGHFHRLCSDLSADMLHDTLPGFHITPGYFRHYQNLQAQPLQVEKDAEFEQCQHFIQAGRKQIDILELARQRGELLSRIIHGDPKLNNFLFEPGSQRVVSLIDLDTVKPGLLHYDIGDCLRSCCHDKRDNSFNLARCRIVLQHYLQEAGGFFSAQDYDYLYAAIWLIPFELGLRFFSDYLNRDQYFKVREPRQNLQRALAQFALCDSISGQEAALRACIDDLKKNHL